MAQKPNENKFMNFIRDHKIAMSIAIAGAVVAAVAVAGLAFFANPVFASAIAGTLITQYASTFLAQVGLAAAAASTAFFAGTLLLATAGNGLTALFGGIKNLFKKYNSASKTTSEVTPVADAEVAPVADAEVAPVADAEVAPVADAEVAPVADVEVAPVADVEVAPVADVEVAPVADAEVAPVADVEVAPVAVTVPSLPLSQMPLETTISPTNTQRAIRTPRDLGLFKSKEGLKSSAPDAEAAAAPAPKC